MTKIVFVQPNGSEVVVNALPDETVMLTAIRANVRGMSADCGGNCACATCHVYVDATWLERLPAPDAHEAEMLEMVAAERRPHSRLACQIPATVAGDGLVVRLPPRQH